MTRGMGCGVPLRRGRRTAVAGVGLNIRKVDFFSGLQQIGRDEVGFVPALRDQIADTKILPLERHQQTGAEGDRDADWPEVRPVGQSTAKALQEECRDGVEPQPMEGQPYPGKRNPSMVKPSRMKRVFSWLESVPPGAVRTR